MSDNLHERLRTLQHAHRAQRETELSKLRERLVQLYQDDPAFKASILAMAVNRVDADPIGVIYDLLRSGFAPLVLAMAEAVEAQRQATLQALHTQRIEMVVPADYAKSERAPDWLHDLIVQAKKDQE